MEGGISRLREPGVFQSLLDGLYQKEWVVYCKEPFNGPDQVVEYLGWYTHRIAISNHRLKSIEDGKVTFSYKDYQDGSKKKVMTLSAVEFIRRFCDHILPSGYTKIRHYGLLSNRQRQLRLRTVKEIFRIKDIPRVKLNAKQLILERFGKAIDLCEACKAGVMQQIQTIMPIRGSPFPIGFEYSRS